MFSMKGVGLSTRIKLYQACLLEVESLSTKAGDGQREADCWSAPLLQASTQKLRAVSSCDDA